MNHDHVISEFNKEYGYLKKYGLRVQGIANLYDEHNVISISTPFIFDRTKLPDNFMGFDLRNETAASDFPDEFQNIDPDKEYIWAYQRFEVYVDKHINLIREKLENPDLTRQEILDALCFGNFEKHKEMCNRWENEGKIPKWAAKSSS